MQAHNRVTLSFSGAATITPTLINESLAQIAIDIGFDAFKQRVAITGVTAAMGDMIRKTMAIAVANG